MTWDEVVTHTCTLYRDSRGFFKRKRFNVVVIWNSCKLEAPGQPFGKVELDLSHSSEMRTYYLTDCVDPHAAIRLEVRAECDAESDSRIARGGPARQQVPTSSPKQESRSSYSRDKNGYLSYHTPSRSESKSYGHGDNDRRRYEPDHEREEKRDGRDFHKSSYDSRDDERSRYADERRGSGDDYERHGAYRNYDQHREWDRDRHYDDKLYRDRRYEEDDDYNDDNAATDEREYVGGSEIIDNRYVSPSTRNGMHDQYTPALRRGSDGCKSRPNKAWS